MATQLLVDIEQVLHELCEERAIPIESVRFFGSRALGTAQDESDVDILLVSPANWKPKETSGTFTVIDCAASLTFFSPLSAL